MQNVPTDGKAIPRMKIPIQHRSATRQNGYNAVAFGLPLKEFRLEDEN
jgi:hypothetical protein